MKKYFRNALLLLATSPLLMQCASISEVEDLRRQLTAINKKIEVVKSTTVGEMQKRQAAAFSQMDQFEEQILELRAQLDESYQLNQRLREQNKELQASINHVAQNEASAREQVLRKIQEQNAEKDRIISQLNQQLAVQQATLENIKKARLEEARRKAEEAARKARQAKQRISTVSKTGSGVLMIVPQQSKKKRNVIAPAAPPAIEKSKITDNQPEKPVSTAPTGNAVPPKSVNVAANNGKFLRAKQLVNQDRCQEAIPLLEEVRRDHRANNEVDATFLIADCYLKNGKLYQAMPEYQRVISQYPQDKRVPDAMLRLATSFEKINDTPTAKALYNKLLKKYGDSPEAAKARERLNKL